MDRKVETDSAKGGGAVERTPPLLHSAIDAAQKSFPLLIFRMHKDTYP